jgi:hypothetical protein
MPTTSVDGDFVIVDWNEPDDKGSEITGYRIEIRNSDELTYTLNEANCDSFADPTILTTTSCRIPIADLIVYPYNLYWGSSIWARVQAYNTYGDSFFSELGNGATIYTIPDAPVNL